MAAGLNSCKAIINIKEWVGTFGVFLVIGLAIGVIATIILTMAK